MQTPSSIVQIFLASVAIKDLAKFLRKCHSIKFPKMMPKNLDPFVATTASEQFISHFSLTTLVTTNSFYTFCSVKLFLSPFHLCQTN